MFISNLKNQILPPLRVLNSNPQGNKLNPATNKKINILFSFPWQTKLLLVNFTKSRFE